MTEPAAPHEHCHFRPEEVDRLRAVAPSAEAARRALPEGYAPLGLRVLVSERDILSVCPRTPTGYALRPYDIEQMRLHRAVAALGAFVHPDHGRRNLLAWILPGVVLFADERAFLAVRTDGPAASINRRHATASALRRLAAGRAEGDHPLWSDGGASAHQAMRLALFGHHTGSLREARRLARDADDYAMLTGHPSLSPCRAALRLRIEDGLAVLYAVLANHAERWPGPIAVAEIP